MNEHYQNQALTGSLSDVAARQNLAQIQQYGGTPVSAEALQRLRDDEVKRQRVYAERETRRWALELVARTSPGASAASLISAAKDLCAFVEGANAA